MVVVCVLMAVVQPSLSAVTLDEVKLITVVDTAVEPQVAIAGQTVAYDRVRGFIRLERLTTVGSLTVRVRPMGAASPNGVDYDLTVVSPVGSSAVFNAGTDPADTADDYYEVVIPAGAREVLLAIDAIDDADVEGLQEAIFQLINNGGAYVVSTPGAATVDITDGDLRLRVIDVDSTASEFVDGEDVAELTYQFYDVNTGNIVGAPAYTGTPEPEIHITREEPYTIGHPGYTNFATFGIPNGHLLDAFSDEINLNPPGVNTPNPLQPLGYTDPAAAAWSQHVTTIGETKTLTYSIFNFGSDTLDITLPINATNIDNCTVNVTQPAQGFVAPDGRLDFIVQITPTTPTGANPYWSFNLTVNNNDSDEGSYSWSVAGLATGLAAEGELVRLQPGVADVTKSAGIRVQDAGNGFAAQFTDNLGTTERPTTAGITTELEYYFLNNGSADMENISIQLVSSTNLDTTPLFPGSPPESLDGDLVKDSWDRFTIPILPLTNAAWTGNFRITYDGDGAAAGGTLNFTITGTASAAQSELNVARFTDIDLVTSSPTNRVAVAGFPVTSGSTETIVGSAVGRARTLRYTFTNVGTAALNITDVAFNLVNTETVQVINPLNSILSAGQSEELIIVITPTAENWSVAPQITTSDGLFTWSIAGTADAGAVPVAIQVLQPGEVSTVRPADLDVDYQLEIPPAWQALNPNTVGSEVTFRGLIDPGTTQFTFRLTALQDTLPEAMETARFRLVQNRAFITDTPGSVDLQIGDDDLLITVERINDATEPSTSGGSGQLGRFRVELRASSPSAALGTIEIPFFMTGSATADDDYGILSLDTTSGLGGTEVIVTEQTFAAATTLTPVSVFADVTVDPVFDTLSEGSETVTMNLLTTLDYRQPTSGSTSANANATLAILENLGVLGVAVQQSGREGAPATREDIVFRLQLPDSALPLSEALAVTYELSGGADEGSDYITPSGTATIPAGSDGFVDITVTVLDDEFVEPMESVVMTVTAVVAGGYVPGTAATASIVDDEPVISLTTTRSQAREPEFVSDVAGSGQVTFSYPGVPAGTALNRPIDVYYAMSGTAVDGVDAASLSTQLLQLQTAAAVGDTTLAILNTSSSDLVLPAGVLLRLPGLTLDTADDVLAQVATSIAIEAGTAVTVDVVALPAASTGGTCFVGLQKVTIPAGSLSASVEIVPLFDELDDDGEAYTITILDVDVSAVINAAVNPLEFDEAHLGFGQNRGRYDANPDASVATVSIDAGAIRMRLQLRAPTTTTSLNVLGVDATAVEISPTVWQVEFPVPVTETQVTIQALNGSNEVVDTRRVLVDRTTLGGT